MPPTIYDLHHGWRLADDGVDVLLTGPGALEIVLRQFTCARLTHPSPLLFTLRGSIRQLAWTYLLEDSAAGHAPPLDLALVLTWDAETPAAPMHAMLRLGTCVSWQLPAVTGQALGTWFAQQEEHRPTTGEGTC